MSVLGQCMAIVNLTSLDWKEGERYSMVAHSFRVMSRARNLDEMVVGLMHEVYSKSDYARGLFHCDVEYDAEWNKALKLMVPRLKNIKRNEDGDVEDVTLLEVNMPQGLSEEERIMWRLEKTKWSRAYKRWLDKVAENEIARHVTMYDLEDKLQILKNPKRHPKELGYPYFVLPWKEHYCVGVRKGRHVNVGYHIPHTDDEFLLKEASIEEKRNLIIMYTRALSLLKKHDSAEPESYQWTEKEIRHNARVCKKWFEDWYTDEIAEKEMHPCDSFS